MLCALPLCSTQQVEEEGSGFVSATEHVPTVITHHCDVDLWVVGYQILLYRHHCMWGSLGVDGVGPALTTPSVVQAVAPQMTARRAVVSRGPEGVGGMTWGLTRNC